MKRKNTKKQKGGFFNIGGRETKSQRDLIVKCDLTDVNSINDPFLMKDKINRCCPSSIFSFLKIDKSLKCNDMKRRYEELLKQNRPHYLKSKLNNISDPHEATLQSKAPTTLQSKAPATTQKIQTGGKKIKRKSKKITKKRRNIKTRRH